MKKTTNKILSLVLALVMVAGMLPMISLTAHAAASKMVTIGDLPYTITVKSATSGKGEDILDEITSIGLNENNTSRTGNTVKIWNMTLYGFGTGNSCEFTDADCGQNLSVDKEFVRGNNNIGYTKVVITITRTAASHTGGTCISQNCTRCGNTYDAPHDYKWKNDGTNHWQECTRNASHIISRGTCSGGTATCHTLATCDTCKYTYGSLNPDNHEWTEWEPYPYVFSTEHYRDCIYHTDIRESGYCDPLPNCSSQVQCSICYVRYPVRDSMHNWGTWESNGDGTHTRICTLNNSHKETAVCSGDSNATCGTSGTCTACDASYIDKNAHRYTYTASGNTVTQECSNGCGHTATAKLTANEVCYTGYHLTPATVEFSDNWAGAEEYGEVTYSNNIDAGTATAKAMVAGIELTTTFRINAATISDGFIILGDALTYNGKEQTQTVEKVLPTGTAPEATYTVSGNKATNVGIYLLTVTGTGNFTGEAKIAYEIAVDKSGVEGLTIENVKSTDKENVEYVYNQLENAVKDLADEEKKTEWNNLQGYCAAMLQRIEIVENGLAGYKAKTAEYDIDTVTSDDADTLESFDYEVGQFYFEHRNNLTEEETKEFDNILSKITALRNRISDIADEIARIESAMNIYDTETVKSSDKADIVQLKADIKALTDGQNITADERAKLENLDVTADALLAKIAETKSEYDRVIAAANGYDEATVTSADKDALVQLNDDIYALALTDNVTAEEKENLENAHNKVLALIDKLTAISNEIKRIIEAVDKYVFESVKSSDKADIQQLISDIKALLDTQNLTADERALLETEDETCDSLVEKIDETVAEINRIDEATNTYDEATVKYSDYKDILQLIDGIKALTDGQNITDDERASLEELNTKANLLAAKIRSTADEISRITRAVNTYNIDTVKSSDKADIENLIARIKKLTDGDNITSDERINLNELDSTLDALLAKIDDTTAEIERIDEAVNSYDKETVTSDDVPELGKLIDDIKALTDSDNLTDDERTALEANNEAIDELVEKLTEVAEEIKRVDEAVKSYDEATVKSTDKADLEQLKEDIQALIDSTNTTENEKTALGGMLEKDNALIDVIDEIEQQIEDIGAFENNFNPEKVTSDDKAAIEEKIAEIENVNPDNLTEEQKAEYAEIKADLEALLEEIAAAEKDVADIGVELDMFDEERVTKFREDDIEALKAKIDELLADENMGESEKAKLNEYKAQCDNLIEIINNPSDYFSMRLFHFVWDALHWLSSHVVFIFNWIVSMF